MVTLLIGHKGSGKTKKLISLANEAVTKSTGNVVVIEGEFENGECIDIRVSFKDDMETVKIVESF